MKSLRVRIQLNHNCDYSQPLCYWKPSAGRYEEAAELLTPRVGEELIVMTRPRCSMASVRVPMVAAGILAT